MEFWDARRFDNGSELEFDLCVIGAGASGITLVQQLDGEPISICLLESGGPDFDEALQQAAYVATGRDPIRRDIYSHPRMLGGASTAWAGRCVKFHAIELEDRPWVGPNTEWPVDYETLDHYYTRAMDVLQVPHPDRFELDPWRADPLYAPYFKDEALTPSLFKWSDVIDFGASYRELIQRSTNIQPILHANVTGLVPSEGNRHVESIEVKTTNGRTLTVKAATFVLAAGGMENVRLLLHSNQLGNEYDLVGRHYMDHPKSRECGVVVPSTADIPSMFFQKKTEFGVMQLTWTRPQAVQRQGEWLNHCLFFREPVVTEWESVGYRAMRDVRKAISNRQIGRRFFQDVGKMVLNSGDIIDYQRKRSAGNLVPAFIPLVNQLEQQPDPDRRVTLNHARPDQFGVPTLQLDWWVNEDEKEHLRALHRTYADYLARRQLGRLDSLILQDPGFWPQFNNSHHPTGALRMNRDPQAGVVNENGRVHSVDNLYVTGSTTFPTVGYANPTFTIVALAVRLADFLKGNRPS